MDREKLEKIIPVIAQKYHFRLEIIEKDYYLTLILNSIDSHLSNKIVFKGGTLLNKDTIRCYIWKKHKPIGDEIWLDTSVVSKPRPSGRGKEKPLSINPEQTSGFSPRCVEWVDFA